MQHFAKVPGAEDFTRSFVANNGEFADDDAPAALE
jgi:hypothetical protein